MSTAWAQSGGPIGHPVPAVLAHVRAGLASVAGTPLWSLRDAEVADLVGQAQAAAAQLTELGLRLVGEADRRDLAGTAGATSTAAWLRHSQRLHPGEAKSRVDLARALGGQLVATRQALAGGVVSTGQATVIARAVADLPATTPVDTRTRAEATLLEHAATFGPKELTLLGRRILDVVDPDAADAAEARRLAREEAAAARRRDFTCSPDGWGTVWLGGRLDEEGAAMVQAALDPLAAPRPTAADGPDLRSPGQRRGDALVELARRALAGGELPESGGEKPHVAVTVSLETLRGGLGAAGLDTGAAISPETARRLACDAAIIPMLLGSTGQPLDVGRSQRTFTGPLRRALVARDKGCAFPGCDRPPAWCDGHHIRFWVDGGPTSLANGVLLCGHHHRVIHSGDWVVRLAADGLPEFIPPEWVDPQHRPQRNTLHR